MKTKTFISSSAHEAFFNLIDKLLKEQAIKNQDQTISELENGKEELERIFIRYNGLFTEIHSLIAEYQVRQIRLRKKIRQIQLLNMQKE